MYYNSSTDDNRNLFTESVGGFNSNLDKNSFNGIFENAVDAVNCSTNCDVRTDLHTLINDRKAYSVFKESMISQVREDAESYLAASNENMGSLVTIAEQVDAMFDNARDQYMSESYIGGGNLLPVKAIDFPVLVKQHIKLASKDIIQTEVVKQPIIKKHIEQTYLVKGVGAGQQKWAYPQCFFNDEYKEAMSAARGLIINESETVTTIPTFNKSILSLVPGATNEAINLSLQINKVQVTIPADNSLDIAQTVEVVTLPRPIQIDVSQNLFKYGKIDLTLKIPTITDPDTAVDVEVKDIVTGSIDFDAKTVSVSSANGKVTGVVFAGRLSNEDNKQSISLKYEREEREWQISDGAKVTSSYSIESIMDAKALADMDLYKKSYNDIADILAQAEDSEALEYLDQCFDQYKGIELDPLGWNPVVKETTFDAQGFGVSTQNPAEYIPEILQFRIDRAVNDLADTVKMDDFVFVLYGNPQLISLLKNVNWVSKPGDTINGIKLDYGYGVLACGNIKVQVVSTKKVNLKKETGGVLDGLRLIPYPIEQDKITFKKYKYTTNILTPKDSNYRDYNLPGGSMTFIVGTSRYTNASVQAIQSKIKLSNLEKFIG